VNTTRFFLFSIFLYKITKHSHIIIRLLTLRLLRYI